MILAPVDEIAELSGSAAAADYLGEPVTVLAHLLQAGALAEAAGAPPALVAAALLHDVGHLPGVGDRTGRELMAGTDNRHGAQGAAWLAHWFPPSVTEPIRLHVPAKRYLCAVEPAYLALLSDTARCLRGCWSTRYGSGGAYSRPRSSSARRASSNGRSSQAR
jgi:gamma-butyrobetaine dioxygenase